jgi:hypothetical protein
MASLEADFNAATSNPVNKDAEQEREQTLLRDSRNPIRGESNSIILIFTNLSHPPD